MSKPDPLKRVAILAGEIVLATPRRKGHYSIHAYVPWRLILELEQALFEAGYDMQLARNIYEQEQSKRKKQA